MFGDALRTCVALKRASDAERLARRIRILIDVSTHPGNLRNPFHLTDFILRIRCHSPVEAAGFFGLNDGVLILVSHVVKADNRVVFRCDLS
jgi:hypothetical protein